MVDDDSGHPRFRVNSPQVISEIIEGELVVINLERGTYYSAEGSGPFIWELIERGMSRSGIVAAMTQQHGGETAEIEIGVHAFLDRLLEEELVLELKLGDDPGLPAPESVSEAPGPFLRPVLNVYSDMADILLLDPVHDVDETGWPRPRTDDGGP